MVSAVRTLQIVTYLDMVGVGLIMSQLPPHAATRLDFNHIHIGLIMSLYAACQTISGPVIGSLSEVKGKKPILILCLCICTFAYAYLGLTASFFVFFGLRAILGLFHHVQFITKALTSDYEKDPKKRPILYGKLMSLGGLGITTGTLLSGHIVDTYPDDGFKIVAIIVASISLLNTGLIYLLPETKKVESRKPKAPLAPTLFGSVFSSFNQSVSELFNVNWKVYWDTILFQLLITVSIGLYYSSFPLYMIVKHRLSSTDLGYVMSFQGAIGVFGGYFLGHINKFYEDDKTHSRRISHLFIILTLSLVGITLVPNVSMIVAILIPKAMGGVVGRTVTSEMMTSRGKEVALGTAIGAADSLSSLTGIVTPVIGGLVMQYYGIVYVFYLAAIFTSIGFVLSNNMKTKIVKTKTK